MRLKLWLHFLRWRCVTFHKRHQFRYWFTASRNYYRCGYCCHEHSTENKEQTAESLGWYRDLFLPLMLAVLLTGCSSPKVLHQLHTPALPAVAPLKATLLAPVAGIGTITVSWEVSLNVAPAIFDVATQRMMTPHTGLDYTNDFVTWSEVINVPMTKVINTATFSTDAGKGFFRAWSSYR